MEPWSEGTINGAKLRVIIRTYLLDKWILQYFLAHVYTLCKQAIPVSNISHRFLSTPFLCQKIKKKRLKIILNIYCLNEDDIFNEVNLCLLTFPFQNARQVITRSQLPVINVSHVLPTVCQVTLMIPAPAKVDFTGRPKMQSAIAVQVKLRLLYLIARVNTYAFETKNKDISAGRNPFIYLN